MKKIIVICFALCLIACSEKSYELPVVDESYEAGLSNASSQQKKDVTNRTDQPQQKKKIIRTAEIRLEVEDMKLFGNTAIRKAELLNGFVESSTEYEGSATLVIKVPENKFQEFISYLEEKGNDFDQKIISSQDVTTEFIDISARIKTKKALEARFVELLKKAKDIPEVMEVERQIESVRSQIESMEGRIKYLSRQTDYSTIHLNYYKESEVVIVNEGFQFFKTVLQNFLDGWYGILIIIAELVTIWPGIIILILIGFFIRRKLLKKKEQ